MPSPGLRLFGLALVGLAVMLPSVGQADEETVYEVISIRGTQTANGRLALAVEAGKLATGSIRVLSQPSNTTLAVVVDPEYKVSAAGVAWASEIADAGEPQASAVTKLPDGAPLLVIPGRPDGDDRVQVWVNGSWPDGHVGERLVSDGRVGPGNDFGFSSRLSTTRGFSHCCEGPDCSQMCTSCPDSRFTCCTLPGCCRIACGFIVDLCLDC